MKLKIISMTSNTLWCYR